MDDFVDSIDNFEKLNKENKIIGKTKVKSSGFFNTVRRCFKRSSNEINDKNEEKQNPLRKLGPSITQYAEDSYKSYGVSNAGGFYNGRFSLRILRPLFSNFLLD